jgi:hypothetical protein
MLIGAVSEAAKRGIPLGLSGIPFTKRLGQFLFVFWK